MKKISLIVEKTKDDRFWGRIGFDDDLLLDSARSADALERKMKKLLFKFHQIDPANIELEVFYDLSALFSKIDYLNASAVASKARISPLLLRQYISGFKYPSLERAKIIEKTINELGQELIGIKVTVVKNKLASTSKTVRKNNPKSKKSLLTT
jgi:hypothetical protein